MESGGSSNPFLKYKYSRRPKTGIVIQEPMAATNIPTRAAAASNSNPQPSFKRDPDQYMPISNVTRIMRRVLPPNAKIADDAKETIQECVSEFISFITTEANLKCHSEYRKTVTPEDVLSAMGSLGFDNYVEPLSIFINKYRAQDPDRGPLRQGPMQHATFVRPSPSFVKRPIARMAQPPARPPPPPPPVMTMGYVPLPPSADEVDIGNYSELPQMVDYLMGNQGGGEGSSSDMHEFDPFK